MANPAAHNHFDRLEKEFIVFCNTLTKLISSTKRRLFIVEKLAVIFKFCVLELRVEEQNAYCR